MRWFVPFDFDGRHVSVNESACRIIKTPVLIPRILIENAKLIIFISYIVQFSLKTHFVVRDFLTDLEIVLDPGILDPSNKMGLAETFWAYSRYFVKNPTNCRKSPYFLINIYLYSRNISCRNKMDRIKHFSLQVRYSWGNYFCHL